MLGREYVAPIVRRELRAIVESHFERRGMSLQENVGHDYAVFQFRMLPAMMRVLMAAEVEPRPSVKPAFANTRDVIGREVVAESVALVSGAPESASERIDSHADAIAESAGGDASLCAVGLELQNVRPVVLRRFQAGQPMPLGEGGGRIPIAHRDLPFVWNFGLIAGGEILRVVGAGTDRHEHPRAVRREDNIARPVTATAEVATRWNAGDDHLRRTACHEVTIAVRKA